MNEFEATVEQTPGPAAWLFIRIPEHVSSALGSRGRVKVGGKVNSCSFESMLFVNADSTHYLMFNRPLQMGTKAVAGSVVRVLLAPA